MNFFKNDAKKLFDVDVVSSELMEIAQAEWDSIIKGRPGWLSESVRTINFAKFICYYTAKKACLDLVVNIEGSDRADYINECIKNMVDKSIRDKVEDACGLGGIILKPSGTYNPSGAIDYVLPGSFLVTEKNSNGDILGIIFVDRRIKGEDYYTRLEYQHFIDDSNDTGDYTGRNYAIENKAFKSKGANMLGSQIPLDSLQEWEKIEPVVILDNVERPLFGYFKTPYNNTIDYMSPEGVAVFSNAVEELKDLDIAWTRKADEADDSQHITFIDESAIARVNRETGKKEVQGLPRFIKGMRMGVDKASTIEEHVPTMLTTDRIADINSILSMISTKCGFSQGQFVLDRKTGRITATQIESDDSETVETIGDIRKALKTAINDLVYALNKYCDVFFDMPDGYVNALDDNTPEEDVFYFKDLLMSFEQDRTRAYQLMIQGIYSKKKYLMEYEGFSEKEVEEMLTDVKAEQTQKDDKGLFDEE